MPERLARRIALIGWDAADWKIIHPLLDAGSMPNLRKLVECGAMGNMATLDPPMSPLLWTSIATGKTADLHGVHGFAEPDPVTGGIRPSTSTSRKVKALWNILSQTGLRSLVVNWFASHPAEPVEGAIVSNAFTYSGGPLAPLPSGAIHPASLASELGELRVHPGDLTGDDLLPFIPRLAEIDQKADRRPMALAKILAENITVQAAATWLMERQTWDFLAVFFDLHDHASHAFMPYHPPRMENVTERDFELYRNVVNGAYCFADAMLGRMVDLAGPETAFLVVSDHGFQSDH
ncbi:MAG TPA: alkaline phosphatase family protein, partial [Candidatus Sulfopaludibacter sp.]|nr:alkaline phosphatase family protein [Candidatus Sulfopaludibacter sp.]